MEFYMKLPRNKKDFILFIAVISIISVNIIAPLITCFEAGFHLYVWKDVLMVLPFIWLSVVALVLITYIPAEKMTSLDSQRERQFPCSYCNQCTLHSSHDVSIPYCHRDMDRYQIHYNGAYKDVLLQMAP